MMFFSGRREKLRLKEKAESARRVEAMRELAEFRGIGETFNYLGAEMVVVALSATLHHIRLEPYPYPALVCEYMTAHGIQRKEFLNGDLDRLRRMNKEESDE